MMAMAGIVLLVACLNLANMFLARGAARRTIAGSRQSLGGGRARILRQLLTEGFLISLAGGFLGLILGVWAARWVVASIVPVLPFGGFAGHSTRRAGRGRGARLLRAGNAAVRARGPSLRSSAAP